MPRPTDAQRRASPQEENQKAKYNVGGKSYDIDIISKTKPNAQGGWDTEIHMPVGMIGVIKHK